MFADFLRRVRRASDPYVCLVRRGRLRLPELDPRRLFPDYDERPVTFTAMPQGPWSTPIVDLAVLLKFVVCSRPRRLLEVGSYRGYTTLLMAQHAGSEARIVAVDLDPGHGEAYRNKSVAAQIERRIGATDAPMFAADGAGSFDLIFVDADHTYRGVQHDTELVLPLVAQNGFLLWHDYANWGYADRTNGVPEYLNDLAARVPIARVAGTSLAVHSPIWAGAAAAQFRRACEAGLDNHPVIAPGTPA